MIHLKDVSYSYDKFNALYKINLDINIGEAIAFIGPNGSGKSTLMKLINGLIYPSEGVYKFNGSVVNEKAMQDNKFSKLLHKKIGFVFQNSEVQLFCSNVFDEIAFGLRQMGMTEKEVLKRVEDILRFLNIEELRERQPYHLSGGEKKKVAIASVLALNPEILVLDEPMNALDPKTKRFIREMLLTLNKAGKTIICSTHDFEYVEGIFERAVVFSYDHTIIRDGNYNDILQDKDFLCEHNII